MKSVFTFFAMIAVIVVAGVTNPPESAHWEQIGPGSELVAKGLTGLSRIVGKSDLNVRYVNGLLGSAIVMKENGETKVLTIGTFGKVWVLDQE